MATMSIERGAEEAAAAMAFWWTLKLINALEWADARAAKGERHWSDTGFRPSLSEWGVFCDLIRERIERQESGHPDHVGALAMLEWDYEVDGCTGATFYDATLQRFPLRGLAVKSHVMLDRSSAGLEVTARAGRGAPFERVFG